MQKRSKKLTAIAVVMAMFMVFSIIPASASFISTPFPQPIDMPYNSFAEDVGELVLEIHLNDVDFEINPFNSREFTFSPPNNALHLDGQVSEIYEIVYTFYLDGHEYHSSITPFNGHFVSTTQLMGIMMNFNDAHVWASQQLGRNMTYSRAINGVWHQGTVTANSTMITRMGTQYRVYGVFTGVIHSTGQGVWSAPIEIE